ncbi:MAG: Gfo/Idh/MocA family oxidoreductase [Clostridia bacterium]|nr:Gfo/Idh/MocA family oxidoreductase [Clostridia bacterium]
MDRSDGMNYAPAGKPSPVVKPGEFVFSAVGLDHGHIYGMVNGLREAGGTLKSVYDPDPEKVAAFLKTYPGTVAARSEDEILLDPEVRMVAGAAVPADRAALGMRAMDAGKDYFTDKGPFTTLAQLEEAKKKVEATGRKYMVYYSERLHVEGSILAGYLVDAGEIGRVIAVNGCGPHRLSAGSRPAWFFQKARYGGILTDIGSHQIEQYLAYAGEEDAEVVSSRVANFAHPEYPELEDFGDCAITGKKGTANYFRVDWFTPAGLSTWGDGRVTIVGTEGFLEVRKYVNLASGRPGGDHVYLVNGEGEKYIDAAGRTGFPFFGKLILDSLERTENAMTQAHAFKAAELCLIAEEKAVRIEPERN